MQQDYRIGTTSNDRLAYLPFRNTRGSGGSPQIRALS